MSGADILVTLDAELKRLLGSWLWPTATVRPGYNTAQIQADIVIVGQEHWFARGFSAPFGSPLARIRIKPTIIELTLCEEGHINKELKIDLASPFLMRQLFTVLRLHFIKVTDATMRHLNKIRRIPDDGAMAIGKIIDHIKADRVTILEKYLLMRETEPDVFK